jgi:putative SOS response-associated peptidase YedK
MKTAWLTLRSTSMFAWAGLWRESEDWGPVYTGVMTRNAPELASIHDRSPVILAREDWETWLNAPLADLQRFDRPWPADDVRHAHRHFLEGWRP